MLPFTSCQITFGCKLFFSNIEEKNSECVRAGLLEEEEWEQQGVRGGEGRARPKTDYVQQICICQELLHV